MNTRSATPALSSSSSSFSYSSILSVPFSSSATLVFILLIAGLLINSALLPSAFAQGSKRGSVYDSVQEKDKDRPDLRDRWMMLWRTAPAGQSGAAWRLRAHQQKMAMRAAAKKKAPEEQETQSGTPWVALGPAPLISDQNFYGAVSGRVTSVAIDPTDGTGNTVYVAGASGGVWKSSNATTVPATSVSWTPLTDQQASLVNGTVSVKPDASVVLVGTGEPNSAIDSYYGVGILRSTDHGGTWALIPAADGGSNSFAGLGFAKLAWSTAATSTVVSATGTATKGMDEGEITGATNRGLYYSGDAGQTWAFQVPQDSGVAISPASISATDVAYDATAGKFYAAIRYHGVYSSTNGQNWARLANQPNPAMLSVANCPAQISGGGSTCPIYRGQLAVVPGRDELYFWFVSIGQFNNVVDEGIWRSVNGAAWTQIDETGIANCGDPGNNGCGVEQGYYNLEIAAVPNGQATDIYAGAVNLFKCELLSAGTKCSTIDNNFPNQWINLTHVYGCSSIASVHPDEHGLDFMLVGGKAVMYFGNDGGIYRTLNGFTTLVSGTCGLTNGFDNLNASTVTNGTIGSMTQFVSFSIHPTDQNTLLGGTQDNGSPGTGTATSSSEWTTVNGGDGGYNAINSQTPSLWYTANTYVNIYACGSGVSCTTDTFSLTVGSEEVGGDVGAFYTPYILDPQNPSSMLVGTCRVWRGAPTVPPSSLFPVSVDFDTLGNGTCTGEEINLVSGLAAGGPTADYLSTTIYATTEGTGPNTTFPSGGEVWVTTNAGFTPMVQVTGNINPLNYTISSVAMDTTDTTGATAYVGIMGFVGTGTHIWKTTNAGASWSAFGSTANGLPDAPVNVLVVDPQAQTIYAGTDVGVFMSSTSGATWIEVGSGGSQGYLPSVPVTAIRIFNSGGTKKLRVSTYGRGIWEYALATTPDYINGISNTPQTVFGTQTATFNGTLIALNGYASAVSLSCTGNAPSTCTLKPTQATPTPSGTSYTLTAGGAIGDYTFNAHAVGTDSKTITHDAAVTLRVVDFFISTPNPDALSVAQGGTSNASSFQVSAAGSFSGTVMLSCPSGLPAGAACQFSPASAVNPTASNPVTVTMTVTAADGTPIGGPSTITLAANVAGAPAAKTRTFTLTVTPAVPDFTLAVTATPNSAVAGQNVTWNGTLTARHGYNTSVNLSCIGNAPSTCTLNPASLVPTASGAAFTVTVGNATAGSFNFSIQGTDGTITHSQAVNLTVGTDVAWTDTGNNAATIRAGDSATYTFSAVPTGGGTFTGTVSFACTNLPALTSCSFNPPSIGAGAGTTAVTLTVATTGPGSGNSVRNGRPSARAGTKPFSPKKTNPGGIALVWLTIPFAVVWLGGTNRSKRNQTQLIACGGAGLAWLLVLASCGGALGSGGTQPGQVTVSPSTATLVINAQRQFTANQSVTWSVTPGAGNGTIDANGLYTAPGTVPPQGFVTVTATSAAAGTTPGTATVTITNPGSVTVTVSPASTSLYENEPGNTWPASDTQQQFSVTVNNGGSQTVTWAVTGGDSNGRIDANGLYTSPPITPNPAAVTITATSALAASPGSAAVTVKSATPLGTANIQVTATAAGGTGHGLGVLLTVE